MPSLYMLLIGCSPMGRNIEQHDVYFGIGNNIRDILPGLSDFWPEAKGTLHLDAWRKVTRVNGFSVEVSDQTGEIHTNQLFFLNLGGYKRGEFEEFHYKMIVAAPGKGEAVQQSKQTAFFKHTGFKGANAHIDDKYGIDVDDIFAIKDILPLNMRNRYSLLVKEASADAPEDDLHLGYFKPEKVDKWNPL